MQWICRRFILFTFNFPYLLPITLAHGSFKIIIETKIYTLRSSSNLMQWTYASLRPFTPYCPTCFLTVDFPSLLCSSVNLTFGRKRCSESVVVSLLHLLLPCFYCPAHQVPWEDRKPYNKKRHTLRCAFTSISGFLSSQAVSSQVLSAFMSLTTVFEMGTGGSS